MRLTFEAHIEPDLVVVWEWFQFQNALIAEERNRIRRIILSALSGASPASLPEFEARLVGLSLAEADAYLDIQRGELEFLTMFELLATAEAVLRLDFEARVTMKWKDSLSRRFRKLNADRSSGIRLDEDILGESEIRSSTPISGQ